MIAAELKPCSRCRVHLASTPRTAYCKSCRAEYQREWRRRKRGAPSLGERMKLSDAGPRLRLRGTPTYAEMLRYRLI